MKSVFFHVFNAYLTDNVNRVSMDFWIPKLIFVSQTALKGIMLHYNQISAEGVNIPAKHANVPEKKGSLPHVDNGGI